MRRQLLLGAGALLACAPSLSAQTIQGQVIEQMSQTAVGAGFVLLLGPDGKEIGRVLTDQGGRFTIRAPAAGRYQLRSERIGFKMTTSPTIDLGRDQTLEYRLEVSAIPIRLEEIRVAGETKCRVRPEDGRATATVWDEARKALAAVSWIQNEQRIRIRLRTYQREMAPDFRIIRELSQTRSGAASRAFRAVPPAQLAARGYIEATPDGGYIFQAPDADVLFSDEFLNAHCFRIAQGDSSAAGMIGLSFEPVGGNHLSDIQGVMWLDEKNAELRYVEFRYLNHGLAVESDVIGGRVEFQRLANGAWLVSRFWIRMPMITMVREQRYSTPGQLVRAGGTMETHAEMSGIREEGGDVLAAFAADGSSLAENLGATLAGTVFDSTRSLPLQGAEIRLAGTSYTTTSGPGGAFELGGLPDGSYTVVFTHRDFPAWGVLPGPYLVTLRRGTVARAELAVPAPANLFRHVCPGPKADSAGAAAGLVVDTLTYTVARDAVVLLTWGAYGTVRSDQIMRLKLQAEVGSDSTGYFRACGLPTNLPITARVLSGELEGPAVEFKVTPGELKELNLVRVKGRK